MDLQRHATQPLSPSITSDSDPSCPHCKHTLHLSPGKAWEVIKNDDGYRRCFQVSNRFVVKCHRSGPDQQYACVLCSKHAPVVSICGDVKALIKHIWEDHSSRELKHEEDVVEVIKDTARRRWDSVTGFGASQSSGKSASRVSSRRRRSLPAYERDHEVFERWPSRRDG